MSGGVSAGGYPVGQIARGDPVAGTLSGVQMGLELAGVAVDPAGLQAALEVLRNE
jgi:hypothetical protein